eukprot:SAG31_NODE_4164_length_3518_cov_6.234864_3_plen_102_part_00
MITADLDGTLAHDYRGYVQYEVKPALDRLTNILHAHFPAIETPPLQWLIDTFPGHTKMDSTNNLTNDFIAYMRAWDHVLARWDEGRLDVLFPETQMFVSTC